MLIWDGEEGKASSAHISDQLRALRVVSPLKPSPTNQPPHLLLSSLPPTSPGIVSQSSLQVIEVGRQASLCPFYS